MNWRYAPTWRQRCFATWFVRVSVGQRSSERKLKCDSAVNILASHIVSREFIRSKTAKQFAASVHADVVHEHRLREGSCRVGAARPRTADSDVEQDEERMIVNPTRDRRQDCRRARPVE